MNASLVGVVHSACQHGSDTGCPGVKLGLLCRRSQGTMSASKTQLVPFTLKEVGYEKLRAHLQAGLSESFVRLGAHHFPDVGRFATGAEHGMAEYTAQTPTGSPSSIGRRSEAGRISGRGTRGWRGLRGTCQKFNSRKPQQALEVLNED